MEGCVNMVRTSARDRKYKKQSELKNTITEMKNTVGESPVD